MPRRVAVGNAQTDVLRLGLGHAAFAQGFQPYRLLQAADHVAQQLLGRGHAQQHADALAVHVGKLALRRIVQHLLRHDERQNLRRIGGGHDARWNAKLHRVKVHRGHEATALGVGLVQRLGVGVVIVFNQPVRRRHVGDQVLARKDVVPEAARVGRTGEQGADTDNGDGNLLATGFGHGGVLENLCGRA